MTNWLDILGLKDSADPEWGEVRGAQISAVRQFALVRLFVSVIAASAVYVSLSERPLVLSIWFAVLVLVSGGLALPQLRQREFPRLSATRGELHQETWGLIGLSLGSSPTRFNCQG